MPKACQNHCMLAKPATSTAVHLMPLVLWIDACEPQELRYESCRGCKITSLCHGIPMQDHFSPSFSTEGPHAWYQLWASGLSLGVSCQSYRFKRFASLNVLLNVLLTQASAGCVDASEQG